MGLFFLQIVNMISERIAYQDLEDMFIDHYDDSKQDLTK